MGTLHGVAGVFFAMSWFVFADGLISARQDGKPYEFMMWLPGLLSVLSLFLILMVNPDQVMGSPSDDFMGTGFDNGDEQRAKVLFFVAAVFALAGVSVSIWKMSDTYNKSEATWPGVALLMQCVAMMASSGFLFKAGAKSSDQTGFF